MNISFLVVLTQLYPNNIAIVFMRRISMFPFGLLWYIYWKKSFVLYGFFGVKCAEKCDFISERKPLSVEYRFLTRKEWRSLWWKEVYCKTRCVCIKIMKNAFANFVVYRLIFTREIYFMGKLLKLCLTGFLH